MTFNISRFSNLIKRDFIIYRKTLIYFFLALASYFGLIVLLGYESSNLNDTSYWFSWYVTALFPIGLTISSLVFWEFKSSAGRIQYLSLPASNLEKIASRQLYVLVIYPILVTVLFAIIYGLFKSIYPEMGIDDEMKMILKYLLHAFVVSQAFVLICAVYFNTFVPVKTIMTSWALFFIQILLTVIVFRIVFWDYFDGLFSVVHVESSKPNAEFEDFAKNKLVPIAEFIGFYVLPVFLWVIAYFKMKEKEV